MWIGARFSGNVPLEIRAKFSQLPGFRWKSEESAILPDHLLDPALALASIVGVPFVPFALQDRKLPKIPIASIPYLRPWIPKFATHYQIEGVEHALAEWHAQSGMFVWSAGSGKTLASIMWACAAGEKARTLAITKSAVRMQWRDQVDRFTEAPAIACEGQKPGALPEHGFAVIGYDVLPYWIDEIKRWRPHSVIFDESHKVKSRRRWDAIPAPVQNTPIVQTDIFAEGGPTDGAAGNAGIVIPTEKEKVTFALKDNQAAAAFLASRATRRRLATTATPIRDRVRDLWAQLDLVRPGEFGSYLGPRDQKAGFAWRYCGAQEGGFGGIDDSKNTEMPELRARLRYICHYVPFSVANRELPPKRRIVTLVRTSEQVRPAAMAADIKAAARSGQRAALVEARLWEAASRKRKRVGDLVADAIEAKQKVCVFTGRRRDCDDLEGEIRGRCRGLGLVQKGTYDPSVPIWVGHGGHSDRARREMQVAYMAAPGPAVLIGTSDAWGEGLDLQDTDLGLVVMLPVTPGQVIQIEGRWVRLGMKRPALIQYLIAESTIDERVAQILLRKLPAIEKVLDSSEEVAGITRELQGADDSTLIADLAAMIEASALEGA